MTTEKQLRRLFEHPCGCSCYDGPSVKEEEEELKGGTMEDFPVQVVNRPRARAPKTVVMAAYEVYSHVYAPQEALITGNCRGGFSAGELIAFLYARSFPKSEWKQKVVEALHGMTNL